VNNNLEMPEAAIQPSRFTSWPYYLTKISLLQQKIQNLQLLYQI